MPPQSYMIRWRGRQDGPHSLGTLREKLSANEIGLMHEVFAGGRWTSLGKFLRELDEQHRAEKQAQIQTRQLEQQRQSASQQEATLQEVQRQNDILADQLDELRQQQGKRSGNLSLYPSSEGPSASRISGHPSSYPVSAANPSYRGISGMAVGAFVCSLLNFVPYLGFITWILALVFGHIALSEMERVPGLGGRGLAIAALVITYVLLLLALIIVIVFAAGGIRKPHF